MSVNSEKVNDVKDALDGAYATKNHSHTGYENSNNKVTSLSSSSTDTQYPSAKVVYDTISELELGGGGSYIDDYYFDTSSKDIVLEYTSDSGEGVGSADIVTSWESTLSDSKVPSEKLVKNTIDNLSIPSASSTTPSADTTTGSVGDGTTWARSNHTHPKSSIYAEASHNHNISNLNNVTTVDVVVTYTNNTTETIKLMKYTGS